jgi:hypothetical protein
MKRMSTMLLNYPAYSRIITLELQERVSFIEHISINDHRLILSTSHGIIVTNFYGVLLQKWNFDSKPPICTVFDSNNRLIHHMRSQKHFVVFNENMTEIVHRFGNGNSIYPRKLAVDHRNYVYCLDYPGFLKVFDSSYNQIMAISEERILRQWRFMMPILEVLLLL